MLRDRLKINKYFLISLAVFMLAIFSDLEYHMPVASGYDNGQISCESEKLSKEAILCLTNRERMEGRLGALRVNSQLQEIAQKKAEDMAKRGYFSHTGPEGKGLGEWANESGYRYATFGENLAVNFERPDELLAAWMDSLSHKENIMSADYDEVGVGIARGEYQGEEAVFVVEYYGSQKSRLFGFLVD